MSDANPNDPGHPETTAAVDTGDVLLDAGAEMRSVSILGATGSIGTSTLDLVERHSGRFRIEALTAMSRVDELAQLARRHGARMAAIGDASLYASLKEQLSGTGIEAAAGPSGLEEAGARPADCVMAAISGAAGLRPTFRAVEQGRRLALANKECLVSAGEVFMQAVDGSGCELLPVDSEHSAAFQTLVGAEGTSIERLVLTASGGPFRASTLQEIAAATPEQALRHPNWAMGPKITIDSATLMNKGLELIEALYLFDVRPDQLGVVVHPQSVVHCLVEYIDGSVLAQLASPDMRTPIALSLSWPRRIHAPTPRLDLVQLSRLDFEEPDETRFPALGLARLAMETGGAAPAVLNAANEVAVAAFLERRIGLLDISALVAKCLEAFDRRGDLVAPGTLDQVLELDASARRSAHEILELMG